MSSKVTEASLPGNHFLATHTISPPALRVELGEQHTECDGAMLPAHHKSPALAPCVSKTVVTSNFLMSPVRNLFFLPSAAGFPNPSACMFSATALTLGRE